MGDAARVKGTLGQDDYLKRMVPEKNDESRLSRAVHGSSSGDEAVVAQPQPQPQPPPTTAEVYAEAAQEAQAQARNEPASLMEMDKIVHLGGDLGTQRESMTLPAALSPAMMASRDVRNSKEVPLAGARHFLGGYGNAPVSITADVNCMVPTDILHENKAAVVDPNSNTQLTGAGRAEAPGINDAHPAAGPSRISNNPLSWINTKVEKTESGTEIGGTEQLLHHHEAPSPTIIAQNFHMPDAPPAADHDTFADGMDPA